MKKKWSWIIPSINQFDMVFSGCIDTLLKFHPDVDNEIILVDDGSEPAMRERIKAECVRRGNIKLLLNDGNLGFPRTINRGMEVATGDFVVLTNNDIVFTQNVTEPFEKAFSVHERIGIVGSLLFYPHGTIQHGGIIAVGPRGNFTHRGWHKTYEQAPEVQRGGYLIGVTGALFAIRREAMRDIGPMNHEYFLACDDTEYCLRSWQKDWRVYYSPDARAIHAEGATRGANDRDKIIKSRHWYIKERETFTKFQDDVRQMDWDSIISKVQQCNTEANSQVPKSTGICHKKIYAGAVSKQEKVPLAAKKSIGVRRTGALGDVLLASGVIRKLKEKNPDYSIKVATVCGEVFKNSPRVSQVVRSIEELKDCETVYDLDLAYEKDPLRHVTDAYALKVFGESYPLHDLAPEMFSTEEDFHSLSKKMGSIKLGHDKVAVLHMGVGWPNRTWSRERWNEVSRLFSVNGYRVVTVGRNPDFTSDLHTGVLNLVNHTNVHEIRELLRRASVFVGMDSGMLHVAMTTEVPAVGLFTVANPDYRVSDRRIGQTLALSPRVECRYCLHEQKAPVTFVACRYNTNHCLNDFHPEDVFKSAQEISR